MHHILAIVNIIGGLMFLLAAVDSKSKPHHNIGSVGFWGVVGCVLVYNGFRIFP